jgi:hypothetical protein
MTDFGKHDFVMERKVQLDQMDRSFDVEYWQRLGPEAIFEAAWEMVVQAWKVKGRDPNELRLQRSVEAIQRLER